MQLVKTTTTVAHLTAAETKDRKNPDVDLKNLVADMGSTMMKSMIWTMKTHFNSMMNWLDQRYCK